MPKHNLTLYYHFSLQISLTATFDALHQRFSCRSLCNQTMPLTIMQREFRTEHSKANTIYTSLHETRSLSEKTHTQNTVL